MCFYFVNFCLNLCLSSYIFSFSVYCFDFLFLRTEIARSEEATFEKSMGHDAVLKIPSNNGLSATGYKTLEPKLLLIF